MSEESRSAPGISRLSILVCDDDIYENAAFASGWQYKMFHAEEQQLIEGLFDLHPKTTVSLAREAIAKAAPNPQESYDLIIVDLFFPDDTGKIREEGSGFADWLISTHPELPVLVWSGGSEIAKEFFDRHRDLFERRALRHISKVEMRTPAPAGASEGASIWRLVSLIYETVAEGRRRRDAALARLTDAASSLLARLLDPGREEMKASLEKLNLGEKVVSLLLSRYGDEGPPDLRELLKVGLEKATLLFQTAFLAELFELAQIENAQAPVTWMAEHLTGYRGKKALNAYRALVHRLEGKIQGALTEPYHG